MPDRHAEYAVYLETTAGSSVAVCEHFASPPSREVIPFLRFTSNDRLLTQPISVSWLFNQGGDLTSAVPGTFLGGG